MHQFMYTSIHTYIHTIHAHVISIVGD